MNTYYAEFLTVALVHLLAVASPGPDFAIVLRQSLCRSTWEAIWTSIGIGTGILIHVAYSLLGLGLIISQSILAFTILKIVGACYLAYIGWQSLRAKPQGAEGTDADGQLPSQTRWQAFRLGLLTNALNPKATLFFVSVFSVVINHETPIQVQAAYGLWMAVMTGIWFCGVAVFFSRPWLRSRFRRIAHWIDRVMGVVLLALAGRLIFAVQR